MTQPELVDCPDCKGTGKMFGFLCGGKRPGLQTIPCLECRGSGQTPVRPAAWLALGIEQRARRVERDESLREMSLRTGVSPVQLSQEERGKVEPLGDRLQEGETR